MTTPPSTPAGTPAPSLGVASLLSRNTSSSTGNVASTGGSGTPPGNSTPPVYKPVKPKVGSLLLYDGIHWTAVMGEHPSPKWDDATMYDPISQSHYRGAYFDTPKALEYRRGKCLDLKITRGLLHP